MQRKKFVVVSFRKFKSKFLFNLYWNFFYCVCIQVGKAAMSNVDATKIAFLENERDELIVQRDQLKEETNVSMTDTVVRSFIFVVVFI